MLAAATTHSLSDINTLPWWAQFTIGLGLVTFAALAGWIGEKHNSCLPMAVSGLVGFAGLAVLWGALFGS